MVDEPKTIPVPEETETKASKKTSVTPVVEATIEVPKKFQKLVEEVEGLSVLELSELVKVFEKKFGVSAAAPAAAAPAAAIEEGKSTVDVELSDAGANKIAVIKAVKEALTLGLKEAKDFVDGAPSMIKTGMKKEDAAELSKKLTDAGAKVTLK